MKTPMADLLRALDVEIEVARLNLERLETARSLLTIEVAEPPVRRPAPLLLEGPKARPRRKASAARGKAKSARRPRPKTAEPLAQAVTRDRAFSLNGVEIAVSAQEEALIEQLDRLEAGDCLALDLIVPMFGTAKTWRASLAYLREAMQAARCTIAGVRGKGFRLENLEASA